MVDIHKRKVYTYLSSPVLQDVVHLSHIEEVDAEIVFIGGSFRHERLQLIQSISKLGQTVKHYAFCDCLKWRRGCSYYSR